MHGLRLAHIRRIAGDKITTLSAKPYTRIDANDPRSTLHTCDVHTQTNT